MAIFDPISDFIAAMKRSERLLSIPNMAISVGAPALAAGGGSPRIVIVPVGGEFVAPEDEDNIADLPITMACHCWGDDLTKLWRIIVYLTLAVFDYRKISDVNVQHAGVDFDTTPDTSAAGAGAIVRFSLRAAIELTPLAADAGTGTVTAIQYTKG